MATWPASLPAPLIDGYAAGAAVPASRPDFGRGWTAHRRRTANLPQRVSVSWVLTADQARDLTLFARDHAGEWATLALRLPEQNGATTSVLARFAGDLSMTAMAAHWRASVEMEIAP